VLVVGHADFREVAFIEQRQLNGARLDERGDLGRPCDRSITAGSTAVRAHVFLCMLAYYVEWHMRQALKPILFDDHDKAG